MENKAAIAYFAVANRNQALFGALRNYYIHEEAEEKKFKEKWELDDSNITINDYGLSDYKGRKIATYITDVNFRLNYILKQ